MKFVSACVVLMHAMVANARPQLQGISSAGSGNGGPGVECKTSKGADGRYTVDCSGVNNDAIALRSEHILWLQGPSGSESVVDITVPNYKIQELIKAGFKTSPSQGTKINILLQKPEQTYDAQVDELKPVAGEPSVNLQYEPVDKTVVHFPNDKPYSPLQGPILPPPNGGASSSSGATSAGQNGRISRQTVYSRELVHPNHRPEYKN